MQGPTVPLLPNLIGSWKIVGGIARILGGLIGHSAPLVPASTPVNSRISLRWLAAALSLTADIKTVGADCQDEALRGKRRLWNSKPSMDGFVVSKFILPDVLALSTTKPNNGWTPRIVKSVAGKPLASEHACCCCYTACHASCCDQGDLRSRKFIQSNWLVF